MINAISNAVTQLPMTHDRMIYDKTPCFAAPPGQFLVHPTMNWV